MFTFAAILTGTMWVYWRMHLGPFLPLQKKLAERWPDSRPRVEGGQRKIHKDTPRVLRVTMYLDFNPTTESGKTRAEEFAAEVAAFVAEVYPPLADYEFLEIRLLWEEREKQIRRAEMTFDVGKLKGDANR